MRLFDILGTQNCVCTQTFRGYSRFVGIHSKMWVPKTVDIQMFRYSKEIIGLQNCGIKSVNIAIVVAQKFGGSQSGLSKFMGTQYVGIHSLRGLVKNN